MTYRKVGHNLPLIPSFSKMRKQHFPSRIRRIKRKPLTEYHDTIDYFFSHPIANVSYSLYIGSISPYLTIRFKSSLIMYLAKTILLYNANPSHFQHNLDGCILQALNNCRHKVLDKLYGLRHNNYGIDIPDEVFTSKYKSKVSMKHMKASVSLVIDKLYPLAIELSDEASRLVPH